MNIYLPQPHISILFFLYALQGVPYGLQSRFLPLVLRSHGLSLTSLGFYKLLYIPWVLKGAYAPLVDSFGTRRRWLQCSIIGLLSCCAFLSTLPESQLFASNLPLLACLLFFNLCAATLDITVDSLAIGMLTHSELSEGNTAQVVGYKSGAVIGGGLLLWLSASFPLTFLFGVLCVMYSIGLWLASSYSGFHDVEKKGKERNCKGSDNSNYIYVLRTAIFKSPSTPTLVLLLLIYKLGEMGAMNILPLMLLDNGMPIGAVGFWTGVVGQISSIVGSSSAAAAVRYFGSTFQSLQSLFLYRMGVMALLVTYAYGIKSVSHWAGVVLMNTTLVVSGTITTSVFTLMMECTKYEVPQGARATHYTLLSTAEVLGKLLFAALGASVLAEKLGYPLAYVVFLVLTLIPPLVLAFGRSRWPFLRSRNKYPPIALSSSKP